MKKILTPEILEILNKPENTSVENAFFAGAEYNKDQSFPPILAALFTLFATFLVFVLLNLFFNVEFSGDYKDEATRDTYYKSVAMKDSAMAHVNDAKNYNRYLDSANKYYEIQNYIINHK